MVPARAAPWGRTMGQADLGQVLQHSSRPVLRHVATEGHTEEQASSSTLGQHNRYQPRCHQEVVSDTEAADAWRATPTAGTYCRGHVGAMQGPCRHMACRHAVRRTW